MTKRIMMPVEDNTGLDAKIAHHFGRAPYFALVEFDENQKTTKVTRVYSGRSGGAVVDQSRQDVRGWPKKGLALDLNDLAAE
jgi:predicted Fe-Mo cluster-binding NifX family protein